MKKIKHILLILSGSVLIIAACGSKPPAVHLLQPVPVAAERKLVLSTLRERMSMIRSILGIYKLDVDFSTF